MSAIGPTLEAFFIERLVGQRRASPHTIASYRDTFRLLISFAAKRCRRPPWQLNFDDLDAEVVGTFLDYLETERHNSVRTRNVRLVAIRSFFSFAALRHPEHAGTIGRVLAISPKRYERNLVTYLTATEIEAVIDACDTAKWVGRRDRAMLLLAVETGLRVSELIGLSRDDVALEHGAHIHVVGKGRKERRTPLSEGTVAVLRVWIAERRGAPSDPLFPTSTGQPLSRDAVEHRLAHYVEIASASCLSLTKKRVSAHTLRHSCAMRLLQAGNDITVIALWLGHFSGVPDLSRSVARRAFRWGHCHILWIPCAACATVSHNGENHAGASYRADRHARVLDGRRRELATGPRR
jgi:site-specific recombinase XerD